jgi:hypothetical protein
VVLEEPFQGFPLRGDGDEILFIDGGVVSATALG